MLKFMKKVPAGTILIPMLVSSILYTINPDLFYVGGMTQALFSGDIVMPVIAILVFASGLSIKINDLSGILKKQGSIILLKAILCIGLGLIFLEFFGPKGIFGVSTLAFVVAIANSNPSLYLSLTEDYASENDMKAYGLVGILGTPVLSLLVFSLSDIQNIDWMPVLTTLIPLVLGIIIGRIDENMSKLMTPIIPAALPLLGWGLGQGINLLLAVQSGFQGILLAILFYLALAPTILYERKVLKSTGVSAVAMMSIAGASISFPAIIAVANPEHLEFVQSAQSQITMALILTSILTPMIAQKLSKNPPKINK